MIWLTRFVGLLLIASQIVACDFQGAIVDAPATIRYEAGGCYGTCPIFSVTVFANGTGIFVGREHVRVIGERRFRLSREALQAFANYVEPLRPASGSIPRSARTECNVGDGPAPTIVWTGADGSSQSFCLGSHDEVPEPQLAFERLNKVVDLLPIGQFVGTTR